MNYEGLQIKQTQYMIFDSEYSDIVTFTSVSGDYDTAFEECAKSITVK